MARRQVKSTESFVSVALRFIVPMVAVCRDALRPADNQSTIIELVIRSEMLVS